ncbi:MAG: hypothetical protein PHO56_03465 [Patescibacteria group bacterium]|nr:hypothetical protein [Patescibacteria group bacterium]
MMGFEKIGQFFADKGGEAKKKAVTAAKIGLIGAISAMPMAAKTPAENAKKDTVKKTEHIMSSDSTLKSTENVTKELLKMGSAKIEEAREEILIAGKENNPATEKVTQELKIKGKKKMDEARAEIENAGKKAQDDKKVLTEVQ